MLALAPKLWGMGLFQRHISLVGLSEVKISSQYGTRGSDRFQSPVLIKSICVANSWEFLKIMKNMRT